MEIQRSRSNSPTGKDTGKRKREKTSSSHEEGSTERTRAQELEARHKRFSSSLDQEIYRDLSKYDNFLDKEEIQEIKDAIGTAKRELELFKKSYENGSETWKKILTSDKGAITIQATYLGLKPKSHISCELVEEEEYGEEFEQYAGDSVGMTSSEGLKPTIHHENSTEKLLNSPKYSDFFDDYDSSKSEAWEYLQQRDDLFIQYRRDGNWTQEDASKYMKGEGFLYGYGDDSARGYPTYKRAETKFQSKEPLLSREQEALRKGFFWSKPVYELYMSEGFDESSPEGKTALKEAKSRTKRDDRNQFIDDHQSEIRSLLEEKFPEIDDDERDALVSYRDKYLFDQWHLVDSRSKRDEYHYAKLEYVFRRSGIPEYLASLKSSTS